MVAIFLQYLRLSYIISRDSGITTIRRSMLPRSHDVCITQHYATIVGRQRDGYIPGLLLCHCITDWRRPVTASVIFEVLHVFVKCRQLFWLTPTYINEALVHTCLYGCIDPIAPGMKETSNCVVVTRFQGSGCQNGNLKIAQIPHFFNHFSEKKSPKYLMFSITFRMGA